MAIRIVVAVTDQDWFETLCKRLDLAEVNFWVPSEAQVRPKFASSGFDLDSRQHPLKSYHGSLRGD